jgi:hypothetical protein
LLDVEGPSVSADVGGVIVGEDVGFPVASLLLTAMPMKVPTVATIATITPNLVQNNALWDVLSVPVSELDVGAGLGDKTRNSW